MWAGLLSTPNQSDWVRTAQCNKTLCSPTFLTSPRLRVLLHHHSFITHGLHLNNPNNGEGYDSFVVHWLSSVLEGDDRPWREESARIQSKAALFRKRGAQIARSAGHQPQGSGTNLRWRFTSSRPCAERFFKWFQFKVQITSVLIILAWYRVNAIYATVTNRSYGRCTIFTTNRILRNTWLSDNDAKE